MMTPPSPERYTAWMTQHVLGDVTGQCQQWVTRMQDAFPELRIVRGHVRPYGVKIVGKPHGYPHWWLITPDGQIIDPTREQFPWVRLTYEPWDESQNEPTGKCLHCGEYCYNSEACCSQSCAHACEAYYQSLLR
jgi:hypothetical protein